MIISRFLMMLFFVFFVTPIFATDTGVDLLIKMNKALHQMNYSGTLVHIKEDDVNTLRIVHEVINGVEREVITSLNDEKDSILSQNQSLSLVIMPEFIDKMRSVYSLDVGAMKKIAQRDCQTVIARPKDKMRYLQNYCIDKKTSLPLAYSLIDKKRKVVERFTFTDVKISSSNELVNTNSINTSSSTQKQASGDVFLGDWSLDPLPKGFAFGKHAMSQQAEVQKGPDTEYFVLTDGLSSISVFISPVDADIEGSMSSLRSGALNVLTSKKYNHRITLVGEVPRDTMKDIFSNLIYQGNPAP